MGEGGIVEVVGAADDRFGERRAIGDHFVRFKVGTSETVGGLFVAENVFYGKAGPARHIHPDQDEWFYVLEGKFAFEVGDRKIYFGARRFGSGTATHSARVGIHRGRNGPPAGIVCARGKD